MNCLHARIDAFDSFYIQRDNSTIETFDFNGDGLDDFVCSSNDRISFYLQDKSIGYQNTPDCEYAIMDAVVLAAPVLSLNGKNFDLLLMHQGGIRSIAYSDSNDSPLISSVIEQETILPIENSSDFRILFYPFVIHTSRNAPSLILPTSNGYQVWNRSQNGSWSCETTLQSRPQNNLFAPSGYGIYQKQTIISINIHDVTNDNRNDLILTNVYGVQENVEFAIYAQTRDGLIPSLPSQIISTSFIFDEWNCIHDINGDGRVDLIKNTWLREPWFIPGTFSGKVLVRIFLAREDLSIPDTPDYVFRKHDWLPRMPIADIDGDGRIDLMLVYDRWRGREEVIKSLSSNKVDFNLRFHFFNDNGYPQDPDCQRNMTIHTREASIFSVLFFASSLLDASLVNLDGDFNGDGRRDLLIRDQLDQLSIYFFKSRKDGFSLKPDITVDVDYIRNYIIKDLNHDGKSDLICKHIKTGKFTIFLSKTQSIQ